VVGHASNAPRWRRACVGRTLAEEEQVRVLLGRFREGWLEILPSDDVRSRAIRLLRIYALRAADALQIAAAQVWAGEVSGAELVTFDERLASVARVEGFRVSPGR
jgi:predicted nucleic acid-binding protein